MCLNPHPVHSAPVVRVKARNAEAPLEGAVPCAHPSRPSGTIAHTEGGEPSTRARAPHGGTGGAPPGRARALTGGAGPAGRGTEGPGSRVAP
ncbi:hypothetical protein EDD98_2406 [Streptomyces sp. PanSC19]|nr:hypothetical protein EDD98_2406 [Streptomyces sp. PanSC19]